MNQRIQKLAEQVKPLDKNGQKVRGLNSEYHNQWMEKFAELIVQDYFKKTIQGLMSDPAFVQAMDEYYEQKWAHRFD